MLEFRVSEFQSFRFLVARALVALLQPTGHKSMIRRFAATVILRSDLQCGAAASAAFGRGLGKFIR
jgi:hypothetical protein